MTDRLEDPTTERLGILLREPEVLQFFLRFLVGSDAPSAGWDVSKLFAATQHAFTNSRLDLVIRGPNVAFIVECKVDNAVSVNKLEKYHREWLRLHGFPPTIFWLVRRRTVGLGRNRYLARELTWNELDDFLAYHEQSSASKPLRLKLREFRSYLAENGILLLPGEKAVREKRELGYSFAFAEELLQEIASRFQGVDFEVIPPGDVKHHRLFIGRQSWLANFHDEWTKRVVLRLKPVAQAWDNFTLSGAILFWNRSYVPDPTFAITQFPHWATICHDMGMAIRRNSGGKWPGKYGYEVHPPFKIERPVKYFGADALEPEVTLRVHKPTQRQHAVDDGCRVVERHLRIVDRF